VLAVSLTDRFADHGLVSYVAAILKDDSLVITDWLMSCRVFSRTLEQFVFNGLVEFAIGRKARVIELCFNPTNKNKVMEGLFESLGMSCVAISPEGPWQLDLTSDLKPLHTAVGASSPSMAT
jgi:FkbH-like protein